MIWTEGAGDENDTLAEQFGVVELGCWPNGEGFGVETAKPAAAGELGVELMKQGIGVEDLDETVGNGEQELFVAYVGYRAGGRVSGAPRRKIARQPEMRRGRLVFIFMVFSCLGGRFERHAFMMSGLVWRGRCLAGRVSV